MKKRISTKKLDKILRKTIGLSLEEVRKIAVRVEASENKTDYPDTEININTQIYLELDDDGKFIKSIRIEREPPFW
jgi:hypothetical protein